MIDGIDYDFVHERKRGTCAVLVIEIAQAIRGIQSMRVSHCGGDSI
jgi:hypothetical protein